MISMAGLAATWLITHLRRLTHISSLFMQFLTVSSKVGFGRQAKMSKGRQNSHHDYLSKIVLTLLI